MPKAEHTHSEPAVGPLSEKSHSGPTPTSPLQGEEIQHLLDAVHDTSGLLAVQHQLIDSLDGQDQIQPLLRHGLYVFTRVLAEHFAEVELRVRDLVQEIGVAIREGGGEPTTAGEE